MRFVYFNPLPWFVIFRSVFPVGLGGVKALTVNELLLGRAQHKTDFAVVKIIEYHLRRKCRLLCKKKRSDSIKL